MLGWVGKGEALVSNELQSTIMEPCKRVIQSIGRGKDDLLQQSCCLGERNRIINDGEEPLVELDVLDILRVWRKKTRGTSGAKSLCDTLSARNHFHWELWNRSINCILVESPVRFKDIVHAVFLPGSSDQREVSID